MRELVPDHAAQDAKIELRGAIFPKERVCQHRHRNRDVVASISIKSVADVGRRPEFGAVDRALEIACLLRGIAGSNSDALFEKCLAAAEVERAVRPTIGVTDLG